jgi:hypothetical protein
MLSFWLCLALLLEGNKIKKAMLILQSNSARAEKKTLLDLVRLEDEVSKVFKRKVDLGVFSSLNPYVAEDVKREMRVIYEKR